MLKKIGTSASIVFMANLSYQIMAFFYQIPVARLLGPKKVGTIALANTIVDSATPFAMLGLAIGIAYFSSKYYEPEKINKFFNIIFSGSIILLASTIVFIIGVIFFAKFYSYSVFEIKDLDVLLYILSITIFVRGFGYYLIGIHRGIKSTFIVYSALFFENLFKLLFIPLVLWLTDCNLFIMAGMFVFSAIISTSFLSVNFYKKIYISNKKFITKIRLRFKEIIKYSIPLALTHYIQIAGKRLDIFFIGYFLTEIDIGIYKPALALSYFVWMVPQAFSYLLFPVMAEFFSKKKMVDFENITKRCHTYILYFNLPIILLFVYFSHIIILIVFGREFVAGEISLIFLTLALAANSIFAPYIYLLNAINKNWYNVASGALGLLINAFLNYLLIPIYGINGAAFATMIAYFTIGFSAFIFSVIILKNSIFPFKTLGILFLMIIFGLLNYFL